MKTYIIKSQGHYKIGKTTNINNRLSSYRTHCFDFEILKVYDGDYESFFHKKFSACRVKGEWFNLTDENLRLMDELVSIPNIVHKTRFIEIAEKYEIWHECVKECLEVLELNNYNFIIRNDLKQVVYKNVINPRGITQLTVIHVDVPDEDDMKANTTGLEDQQDANI